MKNCNKPTSLVDLLIFILHACEMRIVVLFMRIHAVSYSENDVTYKYCTFNGKPPLKKLLIFESSHQHEEADICSSNM